MNFIERWFNVSPDGGDGTLELFLISFLPMALVAVLARRRLTSLIRAAGRGLRAFGVRPGSALPGIARRPSGRSRIA